MGDGGPEEEVRGTAARHRALRGHEVLTNALGGLHLCDISRVGPIAPQQPGKGC